MIAINNSNIYKIDERLIAKNNGLLFKADVPYKIKYGFVMTREELLSTFYIQSFLNAIHIVSKEISGPNSLYWQPCDHSYDVEEVISDLKNIIDELQELGVSANYSEEISDKYNEVNYILEIGDNTNGSYVNLSIYRPN